MKILIKGYRRGLGRQLKRWVDDLIKGRAGRECERYKFERNGVHSKRPTLSIKRTTVEERY